MEEMVSSKVEKTFVFAENPPCWKKLPTLMSSQDSTDILVKKNFMNLNFKLVLKSESIERGKHPALLSEISARIYDMHCMVCMK